ncbi:MAG: YebC/PmpR family DNA-binding transcriptional regulator [Persicimonas sp.]
MAGHSKWANIKHKKAREDAKRGKIFSKLVKKITSAARRGGGDPETNNELRLFIDKAKAANMPKDNIERAIKKGTGDLEGVSYEEFTYEGYGPGGVAIFLTGATDNRNRTVAEVRHIFSERNGNLGEDGCVNWMFKDRGLISISEDQVGDVDEVMELALENGAVDFEVEDGVVTIQTEVADYMTLRGALEEAGYDEFMSDDITKLAENQVSPDPNTTEINLNLIEDLEDHDDIENVYHNLELSDEAAAQLAAE